MAFVLYAALSVPLDARHALDPILAHVPARVLQQRRDPLQIAVTPVLAGQRDDVSGHAHPRRSFGSAALSVVSSSPLPQQPTGMSLAYFVLLPAACSTAQRRRSGA